MINRICRLGMIPCLFAALAGFSASARGQEVHPGFKIVNVFDLLDLAVDPLGDLLLNADGSSGLIILFSEDTGASINPVQVTRGGGNVVTGLNVLGLTPSSSIGSEGGPSEPGQPLVDFGPLLQMDGIDTSLSFLGDVLFFTISGSVLDTDELFIGQRLPDGTVITQRASDSATYGGLMLVPPGSPIGADLLMADYENQIILGFDLTAQVDGSFALTEQSLIVYAELDFGVGDLMLVPSGPLAGKLLVTDYVAERVVIFDLDPITGAITNLGNPGILIDSFLDQEEEVSEGYWGLEVDPLTGNIFIVDFDNSTVTQLAVVPEPASLLSFAAIAALAAGRRRNRR